jgi:hypothetical protein
VFVSDVTKYVGEYLVCMMSSYQMRRGRKDWETVGSSHPLNKAEEASAGLLTRAAKL